MGDKKFVPKIVIPFGNVKIENKEFLEMVIHKDKYDGVKNSKHEK